MRTLSILFAILLLGGTAFAGGDGHGGDIQCDAKIKRIANNIEHWIEGHGPQVGKLNLKSSIYPNTSHPYSYSQYGRAMLRLLKMPLDSSCVTRGEPGYPVSVDDTSKICASFVKNGWFHLTCDAKNFLRMDSDERIEQIHHEFATNVPGLEPDEGPISTYKISTQLSEYTVDVTERKLAIKPPGVSLFALKSGDYGDTHGDVDCGMHVDVDPQNRTLSFSYVNNPYSESPCGQEYLNEPADTFQCTSNSVSSCKDYSGYTLGIKVFNKTSFQISEYLYVLGSYTPPAQKFFQIGQYYRTDFSDPAPDFMEIGPDTLQPLEKLPSGGWLIQVSGDPMDQSYEVGSGLEGPVNLRLDQKIAPNTWATETQVKLRLRNGTECPVMISYQVTFVNRYRQADTSTDGSFAEVQINWPRVTNMGENLGEAITSCGDLSRNYFTKQTEVRLSGMQ